MALTIDGTSSSGGGSALTSISTSITTTNTNDILVAFTQTAMLTAAGSAATVTSMSDANTLTWARVPGFQFSIHSGATGTPWLNIELWWALAAATQTANSVTANLSASVDDVNLFVFGVNGANTSSPWDSSGSFSNSLLTNTSSIPSISGVSTTYDKTMLIMGAYSGTTGTLAADQTQGAGFTLLGNFNASAGTNNTKGALQRDIVSSVQSSVTTNFGVSWNGWVAGIAAIKDSTAIIPGPANILQSQICM